MAATAPERSGTTRVDLPIEGMTCGACAARIERGLSRLDGVATASVNLAAERATVVYDPAVTGPPAFAGKVAALDKVSLGLLDGHIRGCVREEIRSGGGEDKVDELLEVMDRVLRR